MRRLANTSIPVFSCILLFLGTATFAQSGNKQKIILQHVQFSAEQSGLKPEGSRELDEVVVLMKQNSRVTAEIGAHTDASGSASYNLRLSQKRATVVRNYLIKKGVAASRLKAKGYGESKPLNRCGRGVRCSNAEKRKNRRVELILTGLSADSAALAPWLALGGQTPKKPVQQPEVPKMKPGTTTRHTPLPEANNSVPLPKPSTKQANYDGDFFEELNEGKRSSVAKPLPRSFTGYTVELACLEKPLAAGAELLKIYEPVYLRQEAGAQAPYCYFAGAFFTLPEAQQFLKEKINSKLPNARIVTFNGDTKKYFSP